MSATLHLVASDQCLVDHLEKALERLSLDELRKTLLVVPTQRLGTALLVRILESRSAVIPPEILTLEGLIRGRGRNHEDEEASGVAHEATIDLLLKARLEEKSYVHLRPGHERELRLLYGELFDHDLRNSGIDNLKTTIAEDIYKSEKHLGSLYHRAEEIEDVFTYLDETLLRLKLKVKSQSVAEDAKALSERWIEDSARWERIYLIGFTSMAKSWQVMLPTLSADTRVAFWLSKAPKLYHKKSPLQELLETIEANGPRKVEEPSLGDEIKAFHCFVAPSLRDEVRWAKRLVLEALQKGFSLSRIGLLVTDERLYGTAIRTVFQDDELETNIALPETLGGTLAGRHLSSLLQFWREKQSLESLLAFIDHPLTKTLPLSGPEALAKLRRGLMKASVPRNLEAMRSELKDESIEDFDALAVTLKILRPDQTLSLSQWLERLEETITVFGYWESFKDKEKDILQSSQDLYREFAASLKSAGLHGPLMSGTTFWDLVESHLLAGSVRSIGEPLSGLQILSLSEARYFPFDLAIIVGCREGCFPKALPQDELLDNYLKKRVGLPGWEMLEAMEDQTFHLLKARLPNLILLRPARLGEDLMVRSRFTEAILARSHLKEGVLPFEGGPTFTPAMEDIEDEGLFPNWLEVATGRISASRLHKLIYCPYSFLLDSLDIQSEANRTGDADTRREGEWLHAVLQTFITGDGGKGLSFGKFDRSTMDQTKALDRLLMITEALAPSDLKDTALLQHLKTFAWPRYIKHLYEDLKADTSLREYSFGKAHAPITVSVRGITREIHGRIDAIDTSSEWTFVTDYKRRTIPSHDSSKKGLNPQLSLYSIALEAKAPVEPRRPLVLGYWNIYEGKWTAHGVREDDRALLIGRELATKNTPSTEGMIQSLIKNWEWREEEVLQHERFYADPGDHCKTCDYAGVCRKDDPRVKGRIALQNFLERRLETWND